MNSDHLATKLYTHHPNLGEVAAGQITPGVRTGHNPAFILDQVSRRELIIFDPSCAPLLKPIWLAVELRPWYAATESHWLLDLPAGWTETTFGAGLSSAAAWQRLVARYPAIARHLERYAPDDQALPPDGYWWELPSYDTAAFALPRICWPLRAASPRFVWDTAPTRIDGASACLSQATPYLHGMLASRVAWWLLCASNATPPGTLKRLTPRVLANLPIPTAPEAERAAIGALAQQLTAEASARYQLHTDTRRRILKDLGPPGAQFSERLYHWWELDFMTFRTELVAVFDNDIPARYRGEWQQWLATQQQMHAQHTAAMIRLETNLNMHVATLFDLSRAEAALIVEQTEYAYGQI
jgi:hypothetical protein